jgi:hypothetical protein
MGWLRENWLGLAVLVAIVASFGIGQHQLSVQHQQTVRSCERQNPRNAYFQTRADEFTQSVTTGPSYTTKVSPQVFAIMDCPKTVERGTPVPLAPAAQEQYIALFRDHKIPILKDGKVIGTTSFSAYFKVPPASVK